MVYYGIYGIGKFGVTQLIYGLIILEHIISK